MSHDIHRTFNSFNYTIKKGIVSNFDIFSVKFLYLYAYAAELSQIASDAFSQFLFDGDQTLTEILCGMIGIVILI